MTVLSTMVKGCEPRLEGNRLFLKWSNTQALRVDGKVNHFLRAICNDIHQRIPRKQLDARLAFSRATQKLFDEILGKSRKSNLFIKLGGRNWSNGNS